ncbi:MAG: cysteine desulfurase NifS [Smithella sp.]|jgi:cysteine desulfurase
MVETKHIYLDHCATTPVHAEVMEAMLPYFRDYFGNPSSVHTFGKTARGAIDEAREKVARLIGSHSEEIIFTSGGTESDNLAIRGVVYASENKGNHIITTNIEHPAVLNNYKYLKGRGFEVTYIPVNQDGLVDPNDVEKAIRSDTVLISVMHANNEIGTIEPISEIGTIAKERGICFHTDAVQTVGKIPVDVNQLNVDLLSLSGHKIYGPKGIGALYIKKGTEIIPTLYGGGQERELRHGTENVAGVVGLGKACEVAFGDLASQMEELRNLRDCLQTRILEEISDVYVNGHPVKRLPHILNISVESVEGESIVRDLDNKGIAISASSACTSDSIEISRVILALGIPRDIARGTVRISLGRDNTLEEVINTSEVLREIVEKLRMMAELEESLGRRGCV